jgi:GR25 family glycosyltransferase involved in LPS biosynthesis
MKRSATISEKRVEAQIVDRWFPDIIPRIYVVSIRDDRLKQTLAQIAPWKKFVQPFIATDGRQINLQEWTSQGRIKQDPDRLSIYERKTLSRGEIGCFDSHRRLWQQIAQQPSSSSQVYTLILEDDVNLKADWLTYCYLNDILHQLKACSPATVFDLIYLGRSRGTQGIYNRLTENIIIPSGPTIYGTFAYLITSQAARALLKYFEQYEKNAIVLPVDCFLSEAIFKHRIVQCCAVHPMLTDMRDYHDSDTLRIR